VTSGDAALGGKVTVGLAMRWPCVTVLVKPSTCIAPCMGTNHFKALRHGSHSFTCNKHHACLLSRKRSPDGTSTD